MNKSILMSALACSLLSISILPTLADNQYHDKQKTKQAGRNFVNRKIVHADHAVAHAHNKYHRYVHRKYTHARTWLNKH